MTSNELHKAKELIAVMTEAGQDIPQNLLDAAQNPFAYGLGGGGGGGGFRGSRGPPRGGGRGGGRY